MNTPTYLSLPTNSFIIMLILFTAISCLDKTNKSNKEVVKITFKHILIDTSGVHNPWAKIAGDIDGDGLVDIIIGGQKGPLVWYRNPDWKQFEISAGGYETVDGESGDIDGDGDFDIVMGGLFWYENPGTLKENPNTSWVVHQIADHPTHDVEIADINNDGRQDVITRNQSDFGTMKGNTIHLWTNIGNEQWNEQVLECDHGEGLNVIDLDGDGDEDIVAGGFWFENSGEGSWTRHDFTKWHASANLAVADLNNDHRMDIILTPSELKGQFYRISWFEQPIDPINDSWPEHALVDSIDCVIHGVAVGDFNEDNAMDIAYSKMHQGTDPDEVVVLLNLGKGADWDKIILSEKGSHSIEAADINGDGLPDIIGANWSGSYQPVELWLSGKK